MQYSGHVEHMVRMVHKLSCAVIVVSCHFLPSGYKLIQVWLDTFAFRKKMKLSESSNKDFIRLGDGPNQAISFLARNFCVAYEFKPWCDAIKSLFKL